MKIQKNLNLNKTKLVSTMGPTFENPEDVKKMFLNGVTTVRLNTSHGDFEEHGDRIKTVKKIRKELDLPISIMLDTKGPEIRVGEIFNKKIEIKRDQKLTIHTQKPIEGKDNYFYVDYKKLPESVTKDSYIMVDDGKLTLRVTSVDKKTGMIKVISENNHFVGQKKAVNIPGCDLLLPFLGKRDKDFIKWGIKQDIDMIAASFVRDGNDVKVLRKFLDDNGGKNISICSKIESLKAIENINDIISESDSVMIARGDLGVEIPYYKVPFYQKLITTKAWAWGKPTIVATQMLDSMMDNPSPTRAEVSDVYQASLNGADSTMLSGESASGDFPLEAVKTMFKINQESNLNFNHSKAYDFALATTPTVNAETAFKIAKEAMTTDVNYVMVFSEKGRLAKSLSRFRVSAPILALVKDKKVVNQFGIYFGVYAKHHANQTDFTSDEKVKSIAKEMGIKKGEKILIATKSEYRIIRL